MLLTQMHPLILAAITLVLVLLSVHFATSKTIKSESENSVLPYAKKPYLMTNAERAFFKVLHQTVQDRYYIVPQVQLSKIVQVVGKEKWKYQYQNKINLKSVDFVLFDKEYFTPKIVIELDDSSHLRLDRQARDGFLDSVMEKANIKIIHIKNLSTYSSSELKRSLEIL